jgi:hypothetical protein
MNHEDVVWMVSDEKENVTNDSTALRQKLHITIRDYLPNISIPDNSRYPGISPARPLSNTRGTSPQAAALKIRPSLVGD